jgi:hypothetical protein
MDMFAETAIVEYRLSFVDQGNKRLFSVSGRSKQTEVFRFHFQFSENKKKLKLPFAVSSVFRLRNSGNVKT